MCCVACVEVRKVLRDIADRSELLGIVAGQATLDMWAVLVLQDQRVSQAYLDHSRDYQDLAVRQVGLEPQGQQVTNSL